MKVGSRGGGTIAKLRTTELAGQQENKMKEKEG